MSKSKKGNALPFGEVIVTEIKIGQYEIEFCGCKAFKLPTGQSYINISGGVIKKNMVDITDIIVRETAGVNNISDVLPLNHATITISYNGLVHVNGEDYKITTQPQLISDVAFDRIAEIREGEIVLCAAIWYKDEKAPMPNQPSNITRGYVVCGYNHAQCISTRLAMTGLPTNDDSDYVDGFLTNFNRFVDRQLAARVAYLSGQIEEPIDELYSEHVNKQRSI